MPKMTQDVIPPPITRPLQISFLSSFLLPFPESNILSAKLGVKLNFDVIATKVSILSKNKNKSGEKIRNRNKLKKRIQKYYRNIQNYVKELRNKTALYLCRNYERIIIPEFKTQNMISGRNNNKSGMKKLVN